MGEVTQIKRFKAKQRRDNPTQGAILVRFRADEMEALAAQGANGKRSELIRMAVRKQLGLEVADGADERRAS